MGIVFIGIFTLAALATMYRQVKHHNGRAVSFVLCLTLVSIQAIQLKAFLAEDGFRFGLPGYLFLSLCFLLAIRQESQQNRKTRLIRIS